MGDHTAPAPVDLQVTGQLAPAQQKRPRSSGLRTAARVGLGLGLAGFGLSHLTVARKAFRAQVPKKLSRILPASKDEIVVGSGVVEIGLGLALLGLPKERLRIGSFVAAYFVAIFPGNLSQLMNHRDAFGLDDDQKRFVRLLFQPILVVWSLFSGGVI